MFKKNEVPAFDLNTDTTEAHAIDDKFQEDLKEMQKKQNRKDNLQFALVVVGYGAFCVGVTAATQITVNYINKKMA